MDRVNVEGIVRGVAKVYHLRPEAIMGRSRINSQEYPLVEARWVAMMITWKAFGCHYSETARAFGRNHGTIMHAKKMLEEQLSYDKRLAVRWSQLKHLAYENDHDDHDYQI